MENPIAATRAEKSRIPNPLGTASTCLDVIKAYLDGVLQTSPSTNDCFTLDHLYDFTDCSCLSCCRLNILENNLGLPLVAVSRAEPFSEE